MQICVPVLQDGSLSKNLLLVDKNDVVKKYFEYDAQEQMVKPIGDVLEYLALNEIVSFKVLSSNEVLTELNDNKYRKLKNFYQEHQKYYKK